MWVQLVLFIVGAVNKQPNYERTKERTCYINFPLIPENTFGCCNGNTVGWGVAQGRRNANLGRTSGR